MGEFIKHPKIFGLSMVAIIIWFYVAGYSRIYGLGIWKVENELLLWS